MPGGFEGDVFMSVLSLKVSLSRDVAFVFARAFRDFPVRSSFCIESICLRRTLCFARSSMNSGGSPGGGGGTGIFFVAEGEFVEGDGGVFVRIGRFVSVVIDASLNLGALPLLRFTHFDFDAEVPRSLRGDGSACRREEEVRVSARSFGDAEERLRDAADSRARSAL